MAKKSDKNLLNENTIRRMMKLAEIDSLSSDFITRNYVNEEEELEESVEEQSIEEGEVEVSSDISEEMEEGEEEMEMDAEMEDDAADAGDEVTISDEEAQDIIALADKLRAAVGEDEPEEPGEEMEMDAEMDMDMGSDEMEMSADMEEEPGKRYDDAMMEELKESIYKKVIERLLSEVKKEK
jgi:hypothetical protein